MIDLLPSDDQQSLIDNFRAVLDAEAPFARLHERRSDDGLIARLAELGWIGLGLSEADGGIGLGVCEEILLFREAGRALVSPRFMASVLGAHTAAARGDAELAARIVAGAQGVALVTADHHRLDGRAGDLSLWIDEGGAALVEGLPGVGVAALDATVGVERLDSAAAPKLADDGSALSLRCTLLVAATLVGLAEAARDMATAYAKDRQQFGQPIGAFQTIKHRCADMAVSCEAGWSLTIFAALAFDGQRSDTPFQIAAARIVAGDAALAAARANVQIHGGMGFTDEADPHLLVKRCHLWLQAARGTRQHKAMLLAEAEPVRGL